MIMIPVKVIVGLNPMWISFSPEGRACTPKVADSLQDLACLQSVQHANCSSAVGLVALMAAKAFGADSVAVTDIKNDK